MTAPRWLSTRRWLLAAAIGGVAVLFVQFAQPTKPLETALPQPVQTAPVPGDYASSVAALDAQIRSMDQDTSQRQNDWLNWEDLAVALHSRSRLTGSFDDLARAQVAMDRAFALARPGAGPHLTQALIHFSAHRLGKAQAALDAIARYKSAPPLTEQADAEALRGDIAFYSGDMRTARGYYTQAEQLLAGEGTAFRRAILAWRTGNRQEADRQFQLADRAVRVPTARGRANLLLQRAALALEFGDRAAAGKLVAEANRLYPGDWRTEMRKAQLAGLGGNMEQAIRELEAIAERTGEPDPMEIVAGLATTPGAAAKSRSWAARAGAIWRRRIAILPEASLGHALDYELALGDPRQALVYAARNVRARPYGDALVGLAKAWLANGRADYAAALIARVNASEWNTVEQHLVGAEALALLGRGDEAEAERQKAIALNPDALTGNPAFVRLSH